MQRGLHTTEIYVSLIIGTRAVDCYIEDGCYRGVTVKRGSTVHVAIVSKIMSSIIDIILPHMRCQNTYFTALIEISNG